MLQMFCAYECWCTRNVIRYASESLLWNKHTSLNMEDDHQWEYPVWTVFFHFECYWQRCSAIYMNLSSVSSMLAYPNDHPQWIFAHRCSHACWPVESWSQGHCSSCCVRKQRGNVSKYAQMYLLQNHVRRTAESPSSNVSLPLMDHGIALRAHPVKGMTVCYRILSDGSGRVKSVFTVQAAKCPNLETTYEKAVICSQLSILTLHYTFIEFPKCVQEPTIHPKATSVSSRPWDIHDVFGRFRMLDFRSDIIFWFLSCMHFCWTKRSCELDVYILHTLFVAVFVFWFPLLVIFNRWHKCCWYIPGVLDQNLS